MQLRALEQTWVVQLATAMEAKSPVYKVYVNKDCALMFSSIVEFWSS